MTNLQWVKASERKPGKEGWVYLRFPNDNPAVIYYTKRDNYLPHSCEWLAESPSFIEGKEKKIHLDIDRFSQINRERAAEGFKTYKNVPITYWTTALAGELGELCNMIKKQERVARGGIDGGSTYTAATITKADIAEEFGGIFIYLDLLAGLMDVNLSEAIIETFNSKSEKYKFKQYYPAPPYPAPIEQEKKVVQIVDTVQDTINAIREQTAKILSQGPEACRKYLKDAGIQVEDDPSAPTSTAKPSIGESLEKVMRANYTAVEREEELPQEILEWINKASAEYIGSMDTEWKEYSEVDFGEGAQAMYHHLKKEIQGSFQSSKNILDQNCVLLKRMEDNVRWAEGNPVVALFVDTIRRYRENAIPVGLQEMDALLMKYGDVPHLESRDKVVERLTKERDEYRKLLEFVMRIRDLWGPAEYTPASEDGEAVALSAMEFEIKTVLAKYPPQS